MPSGSKAGSIQSAGRHWQTRIRAENANRRQRSNPNLYGGATGATKQAKSKKVRKNICANVIKQATTAALDGALFSDGEICNGVVTQQGDEIYFQAIGSNGSLHERGDEMPFRPIKIEASDNNESIQHCQNCNEYKHPGELKAYGSLSSCCRKCREKLDGVAMRKQ